jgi:hypothetical protein
MRLPSPTLFLLCLSAALFIVAFATAETTDQSKTDFSSFISALRKQVQDESNSSGKNEYAQAFPKILDQLLILDQPKSSKSYLMSAGIILLIADLIFLFLGVGIIMVFNY